MGAGKRGAAAIGRPHRLEHHSRVAMRSFDIDPDQAISIVAILLFIDAAFIGFPLLSSLVRGATPALFYIALVAGLIAGGIGLLKGQRWGWYVALGAICLDALWRLATISLLALLIDALVIFLLTRSSLRARFGVR
jgi:hypothetical protein